MKLVVFTTILGTVCAVATILYAGGFFNWLGVIVLKVKMKKFMVCWCAKPAEWKVIFKPSASKPAVGRCRTHVGVFSERDVVLKIEKLK